MSTLAFHLAVRSRWLNWKPKARVLADATESELTKPSKPSSVGFEGATSAESSEIEAAPDVSGWSWAEWKAGALNRLFQEQGTSGQPGRITAETVRHGERSRGRRSGNESPPFVQREVSQADATHAPNRAFGGRGR
jgi:hypothetical protein